MTGEFSFELVQSPTRSIHIIGPIRIVECEELSAQFLGMFRLDAGFRTRLKEPLNAMMPKGLYHRSNCIASLYDMSIFLRSFPDFIPAPDKIFLGHFFEDLTGPGLGGGDADVAFEGGLAVGGEVGEIDDVGGKFGAVFFVGFP